MITTDDLAPLSDPSESLAPVQVGRYRILERLGTGGMGTVYKAQDPQLNRIVAIKWPQFEEPPHSLASRRQRFQREARAAAQVWHSHVCPIYDVGEHEGHPYVVMAYVEGQSLAKRLAERGRYEDVGEAVTLIRQVLDALEAVHAHRIIHRDIKPSNILIDRQGRAILADFGLARSEESKEQLTSDGVVVGTPAYMAPEQAAGQSERIGPWTDLYSLGVVFFEMLTRRLPFEGPPLTVLSRILHEEPPPPSSLRPDIEPALDAIVLTSMACEPQSRFQSARQFNEAFARWLPALPRGAVPPVLPPTEEEIAAPDAVPIRLESSIEVPKHTATRPPQSRNEGMASTAEEPRFGRKARPFTRSGTMVAAFLGVIPGGLLGWLFGLLGLLCGVKMGETNIAVRGLLAGMFAGFLLGPVAWGAICGYWEAQRVRPAAKSRRARSRIGFCGLQFCACLLGIAAGLLPGFSYTRSFWGIYHRQIGDNPVWVHQVDPGSPAAEAGFQVGDSISHPNGFRGLERLLKELRPGDKQFLTVIRGGRGLTLEMSGVRPQLAAIWYQDPWYPIAGAVFLALGLFMFATAQLRLAPLWRSIPAAILGLGLAVGFGVALAGSSTIFARLILWQRWPMGSGEEWYFGQGFVGITAGFLVAVFAAAEIRQRLGSRKENLQGIRVEPSATEGRPIQEQ